ncbi:MULTISPECIES: hypothetical protein [Streptomyces]|nr:hypothetical protein [Streptomyces janthinus]WND16967.1 hypothetical protein RI060_06180 [Streptomyces janthinus]GGS41628.1 hypothetical protein GCM10010270_09420 [Streptomyces janthinus]
MRRSLAVIGVTLTTAVLGPGFLPAAAAPGTGAATGTLIVNGVPHTDPHGCYPSNGFLVSVVNRTDRTAYVYPNGGCFGQYEGWVQPGGQATMNGSSVYID